jgi:hypothetical protein
MDILVIKGWSAEENTSMEEDAHLALTLEYDKQIWMLACE